MLPFTPTSLTSSTGEQRKEGDTGAGIMKGAEERAEEGKDEKIEEDDNEEDVTPKDFERGLWMDPGNTSYGRGKRHQALHAEVVALAHGTSSLEETESVFVVLTEDEPDHYRDTMNSPDTDKWKDACKEEYNNLMGYRTWTLVERPAGINIVGSRWTFRTKRDNLGQVTKYKARLVAQGYSQIPGLDFNETYSPTI